jgi:hypothetical protein
VGYPFCADLLLPTSHVCLVVLPHTPIVAYDVGRNGN